MDNQSQYDVMDAEIKYLGDQMQVIVNRMLYLSKAMYELKLKIEIEKTTTNE